MQKWLSVHPPLVCMLNHVFNSMDICTSEPIVGPSRVIDSKHSHYYETLLLCFRCIQALYVEGLLVKFHSVSSHFIRIACVFLHSERGRSSKRVWRSPRVIYLLLVFAAATQPFNVI
jgi:hypothetical protein